MPRITPRYNSGDMFTMGYGSRIIVSAMKDSAQWYQITHVMEKCMYELWTFEKMHYLIDREKLKFVCNIFQIIVVPITFFPPRFTNQ